MKILIDPQTAAPVTCPYLPDRHFVQDYFFATDLSKWEFGALLRAGWRRFGTYFFRPNCSNCKQCIPIRVDAEKLNLTSSLRRVRNRGEDVQFSVGKPRYSDEIWELYRNYSMKQFGNDPDREEFRKFYFESVVPSLQTEYRLEGQLIGVGFLDVSYEGMSSVYFSFYPQWGRYSLGSLSVLRESELVIRRGGRWYYLGYWVPGSKTMDYKIRFAPNQLLDWETMKWVDASRHPVNLKAPDNRGGVLQGDVDDVK